MADFAQVSNFSSLRNFFGNCEETFFSVVHVNIRSIRKHWAEFEVTSRAIASSVDVFVLTEINIPSFATDQFSLPGYRGTFYTRDMGHGGGIAVFVSDKWSFSNISLTFAQAEFIALSVENSINSICLLAMYRPPSTNIGSFLVELEENISDLSSYGQLCIIGDFNIDILNGSKSNVCNYLNTLATHGIESVINCPTREEFLLGRLVSSCIDHINLRTSSTIVKSAVIKEKLADHYFVACRWSIGVLKSRETSGRINVTGIDTTAFDKLVSAFDWNHFLRTVNYTDVYPKFVLVFKQFYERCRREIFVKKRNPDLVWLNANILDAIREKNALWARCRRSPNDAHLRILFKSCRNKVNAMIRSAKRISYHRKFSQSHSDARKTWSLINELRGHQRHSIDDTLERHFGDNLQSIVEDFNVFFCYFFWSGER